jgi:hypothetical protein
MKVRCDSKRRRKRFFGPLALSLVLFCLALAGCGGGGGGGSDSSGAGSQLTSGEVIIGLTDTSGDFIRYAVDVVSITLTKANGAVVETLPLSLRVDFSQYVAMTEFISAATIPSGVYTSARIRLDYTGADIQVEDNSGNAVAAKVQDPEGRPIDILDLTVRLDERRALVVVPGIPAHLTLDFNLSVSNSVDTTLTPPVVTVEPFLVAQVNPEDPKIHRVRGPLRSVDLDASSFQIFLCPYHRLTGKFGTLTVGTNADTLFEIDGLTYQGGSGLTKLGGKPLGTAVVAVGDLNTLTRRFIAREVYAGSSVAFGTNDAVTGSVIARSGDALTVRGATLVRADGTVLFNDSVTVQLANTTIVTGQGTLGQVYTKEDISIGQMITALGTLSGDSGSFKLDGAQGLVRMLATVLTGTVNHLTPGQLSLNLQTINGRRVSLFNFAGTGGAPADDADPANYEVDTGALSLSGLSAGTPVRVRGFVRPFGKAPPDFAAWTVVNVASLPAILLFDWNPPTDSPFTGTSSTALSLNPAGVGSLHHILRGGVVTDVLPDGPVIEPQNSSFGWYAIGYQGTVQLYTKFEDYRDALLSRLGSGQETRLLGAHGTYDDGSITLSASGAFTLFQ